MVVLVIAVAGWLAFLGTQYAAEHGYEVMVMGTSSATAR